MVSPLSEFTLHRRVQFAEVDSARIVHFSQYFRYMEEAEHAMWREAGLSIAAHGRDVGFPRVAAAFDYRQPLYFEDEFTVHLRIIKKSARSIGYRCEVRRGEAAIATGSLTIVCVDQRTRPFTSTPFPPDIADRFAVAPTID